MSEIEMHSNAAQTVAELVKAHIAPVQITLTHPVDGIEAPVIVLPGNLGGLDIHSVDPLFDAYRTHPQRRKGTAMLGDLDSFIAHVNRFKDSDSAVFANPDKTQPSLTAVLDYHQAVNRDCEAREETALPRFGVHRAGYRFPLTAEWKAWNASNKKPMGQADFAAFVEERALDILPAPTFQGELSEADQKLKALADLLNGKFAAPEKMMALSRGLAIFETAKVINATNINSGEGTITFEEEHQDSNGKKLEVPNLFCIGVPVFDGGEAYRVVVRLRYRKDGSKIAWHYDMYRHDVVFDDAFKGACQTVATGTDLPLFVGAPEA